jgi:hypothetical protein
MWCVKVPTGAFVASRNGKAFVTGNSGFPKSMNVSSNIHKAIDTLGQEVYQSWKNNSKIATLAGQPSQSHLAEAGPSTTRSGSVPELAAPQPSPRSATYSVSIVAGNSCGAHLIAETDTFSVPENAVTCTSPSKSPVRSVGKWSVNLCPSQGTTTFIVHAPVRGWPNESLMLLKTKDGEALKTWLGRWWFSDKRDSAVLFAALIDALRLTTSSPFGTSPISDMIPPMDSVSAISVTITESTAESLISFMVDTLKSEVAKMFAGHGTALKPAFEPFIVGRKPMKREQNV